MSDYDDSPPLGCASYFAAHCLATYALTAIASESIVFPGNVLVLFAPLLLPAISLFALILSNSELPIDTTYLLRGLGLYVLFYFIALKVLRKCAQHPRLGYFVWGGLASYLALIIFGGIMT